MRLPLWLPVLLLIATPVRGASDQFSDRAFLLEEAFAAGENAVRHTVVVAEEDLTYLLTVEGVATGAAHHVSCSIPFTRSPGNDAAIGDVSLDYRRQWTLGRTSVAPRVSMLFPTGATGDRRRNAAGFEVNVPVSIVHNDRIATHWGVGASSPPGVPLGAGGGWTARGGIVFAMDRRVALVFEAVHEQAAGSTPGNTFVLSPGVRYTMTIPGGLEITPGIAAPTVLARQGASPTLLFHVTLALASPW